MLTLTIFRQGFCSSLQKNIDANLQNYQRDETWVQEVGTRKIRDLTTRIELETPLALDEPDNGNLKDLENAIRVHRALKDLTPLQARDPRLWARLTHVDAWRYMRKRWDVEKHTSDVGRAARYIAAHYFVPQNESRALIRNGIARLWWMARLTYDDGRSNPYELTGVLFSSLDIAQQLLERNMGRASAVLRGFLEFLLRNRSTLLTGGEQNRERIRRLAKLLNLAGGVCVLDSLSQTEIIHLLEDEFASILRDESGR